MQPLAVALAVLDGMPEGMSEVQDRATPRFTLVLGDNFRLQFTGSSYRVSQCVGIAAQQCLHIVFEPGEKSGVTDCTVFDDFGEPRFQFAIRQRIQRVAVSISTTAG